MVLENSIRMLRSLQRVQTVTHEHNMQESQEHPTNRDTWSVERVGMMVHRRDMMGESVTTRRHERHAMSYERVRSPKPSHKWNGAVVVMNRLKNRSRPEEQDE
jgi:hypothetical protein